MNQNYHDDSCLNADLVRPHFYTIPGRGKWPSWSGIYNSTTWKNNELSMDMIPLRILHSLKSANLPIELFQKRTRTSFNTFFRYWLLVIGRAREAVSIYNAPNFKSLLTKLNWTERTEGLPVEKNRSYKVSTRYSDTICFSVLLPPPVFSEPPFFPQLPSFTFSRWPVVGFS